VNALTSWMRSHVAAALPTIPSIYTILSCGAASLAVEQPDSFELRALPLFRKRASVYFSPRCRSPLASPPLCGAYTGSGEFVQLLSFYVVRTEYWWTAENCEI
jgi:hypothetical protein